VYTDGVLPPYVAIQPAIRHIKCISRSVPCC